MPAWVFVLALAGRLGRLLVSAGLSAMSSMAANPLKHVQPQPGIIYFVDDLTLNPSFSGSHHTF